MSQDKEQLQVTLEQNVSVLRDLKSSVTEKQKSLKNLRENVPNIQRKEIDALVSLNLWKVISHESEDYFKNYLENLKVDSKQKETTTVDEDQNETN
jgi:hypothetical protein